MKTIMQLKNFKFILVLLVAYSCANKKDGELPHKGEQIKEYEVMAVEQQSTILHKDYPTILQGQQTIEIRPRITAYIEEILVDEGASVKKGQILFRLNANDIQANVRSAKAQVKVAEAEIVAAKVNVSKTKPLVEKNIISKFNLESVAASLKAKEAQLAQAKANLENAKANLQYTVITSPTDGIIGNFPYRVGSLVSSATALPLTTVSNTSSIYAYFSMNEKEFMALTKKLTGNNLQEKLTAIPDVSLVLADNTIFEQSGQIETASGLVDQQTGAINVRATFQNPTGELRSGGSGSIRLLQHLHSSIIIPQKATYELQGKYFVYVVGAENKIKNTEVEVIIGNLKDSYVVTNGLNAGDQVVIEGIISLRNGITIKPKLVESIKLAENMNSADQDQN